MGIVKSCCDWSKDKWWNPSLQMEQQWNDDKIPRCSSAAPVFFKWIVEGVMCNAKNFDSYLRMGGDWKIRSSAQYIDVDPLVGGQIFFSSNALKSWKKFVWAEKGDR